MSNQQTQNLRDENFALKLAASQQAQNNYLVNQIRPCPIPAYPACNPWAGSNCGCNPNRYSSGRYAPTGRGTRGYRPYEDLDMIDAWAKDLDDNGMRYRMGFNAGGRSGVKISDGIRSGGSHMVDPDMYSEHSSNWDSRYGDAYNKYRTSRKHYTESKSAADKLEMDEHANEHINDTIATMKEIYKSADPDMRKRMKENVQKLVSEMIV